MAGRRAARLGHGEARRHPARLRVAQFERALAMADRRVDLAKIEIRDLEGVEHSEVLAMPLEETCGQRDRLLVALGVRQCRDQRLVEARVVRLQRGEFLTETLEPTLRWLQELFVGAAQNDFGVGKEPSGGKPPRSHSAQEYGPGRRMT